MRIRKRAVPFSSDLQLQLSSSSSQPSDPPDLLPRRPIPPQSQPLKPSQDANMINIHQKDEHTTIHPSKQSDTTGAVADYGVPMVVSLPLSHPSKSDQPTADGRWCDGDKAIPLKKRKASFQMNGMVVDVTGEYSNKMKSKTNKNCPLQEDTQEADGNNDYDNHDDDDYYEEDDNNSDSEKDSNKRRRKRTCKRSSSSMGANTGTAKTKTKKKRGGGVIMEGSRCSRVNGRGWRCMQPTLVGYSLCEHHLGKGRLRSMSSVRARSTNSTTTSTTLLSQLPPPLDHDDHKKCSTIPEAPKQEESTIRVYDDDDDDYDEQGPPICAGNGRKRTRIGMVKARSLSSLLCLPDTTTTIT